MIKIHGILSEVADMSRKEYHPPFWARRWDEPYTSFNITMTLLPLQVALINIDELIQAFLYEGFLNDYQEETT